MVSATINVQGRTLKITVEDNDSYYAPQWIEDKQGEICFDDFTSLLNFPNPRAALKQIGRAVIGLCSSLDKPVYFIGSTDKRTRVYAKLLKSCGFAYTLVHEPIDGDLAICVDFSQT